jgi:hypothetical protein
VDWRDFFPAFKWVPNKSVEDNIKAVERKRTLIIKGLIKEQRRRLKNQPEVLISRNLLDSNFLSWNCVLLISLKLDNF